MSGTIVPSPAAAYSTAPFTDGEKADIRRFSGYPPYGTGASGFQSWRFFQAYGMLEFRLNNMAPAEVQDIRKCLGELYGLEDAVLTAGVALSTDAAAVWTRNKREMQDRQALLDNYRRKLCLTLIGVPLGPEFAGWSSGSTRIVV